MSNRAEQAIIGALQLRAKHGRHMHHSQCIHNLPPEEQVEMRGKSIDWWMTYVGSMPIQITPDEWEIDAPNLLVEYGPGAPVPQNAGEHS